jgi:hypothetical protein
MTRSMELLEAKDALAASEHARVQNKLKRHSITEQFMNDMILQLDTYIRAEIRKGKQQIRLLLWSSFDDYWWKLEKFDKYMK